MSQIPPEELGTGQSTGLPHRAYTAVEAHKQSTRWWRNNVQRRRSQTREGRECGGATDGTVRPGPSEAPWSKRRTLPGGGILQAAGTTQANWGRKVTATLEQQGGQ